MRQPSKIKSSPNTRYSTSKRNTNVRNVGNSDIIRLYADYAKPRKVMRGMIIIETTDEKTKKPSSSSYTIYDKEWIHKLNGTWVMVRRVLKDPEHVYIFDLKTDTYLFLLSENVDAVGDKANSTSGSKREIGKHCQKLKVIDEYRKMKMAKVIESIEEERVFELPRESIIESLEQELEPIEAKPSSYE